MRRGAGDRDVAEEARVVIVTKLGRCRTVERVRRAERAAQERRREVEGKIEGASREGSGRQSQRRVEEGVLLTKARGEGVAKRRGRRGREERSRRQGERRRLGEGKVEEGREVRPSFICRRNTSRSANLIDG